MADTEETTTTGTRRRGRPKGSKNTTAKAAPKPANGKSEPAKRRRRKKADAFDPSTLTFDQVIATVKYAQEKLGDLGPILPPQE